MAPDGGVVPELTSWTRDTFLVQCAGDGASQLSARCAGFTVFALPFFIGLNAGTWAYGTGAGWLGGIFAGLLAAGLTLAIGQGLLMLVRPIWARLLIALAFVAPAGMAGFYASLVSSNT